jgi:fructose/tagatose bisphosphate aldolase
MSALQEHLAALDGAVHVSSDHSVTIQDPVRLRAGMDRLAHASALGGGEAQATARWLIWASAQAAGIHPASIHDLYLARGRGETPTHFTVPAMNLRAMAYDSARAVFSAARSRDVGAMIFEIARSEMGYTDQRPAEYVASVLAAAVAEGYRGPVFIQGDHFQVSAKRYVTDPAAELGAVRDLIREAIAAGFFNIDVDTSTLVDLAHPTLAEQQAVNAGLCAELTRAIRSLEPAGVTISVGGEIGEVGGKNSTAQELEAFMAGFGEALGGLPGLSKISIQTGTSHGGVVLPDGSLAQVSVDFDTLAQLSKIARERYGMAGAVQHGASTLPESAFRKFAECEACEVHLATNFQNMLFDRLPDELRRDMFDWLLANKAGERKAGESDEQFIYKNRKHAIGPFKAATWDMDAAHKAELRAAWQAQFGFLFEQLNVVDTLDMVHRHVEPVVVARAPEDFGAEEAVMEEVEGLAD